MFSGGDSSDGINSLTHFAPYGFVNQVAITNAMAAGQNIDWAQLAQQWIQMRDNSELNVKKDSDVSANKVGGTISNSLKFEEKGEADMDMDDEEHSDDKAIQKNSDFATSSIANNDFNQSWFVGEDNSHITPQSSSNSQWNPWPGRENLPNQNQANNRPINSTSHIPSLLKINVPHPNEIRVMPDIPNQTNNANMMDAAKRKGLPAWIREGLEKMEREKQKQLEKVQQNKDIYFSDDDNPSNTNIFIKPTSSLSGIPPAVLHEESTDNEDEVIETNAQSDINLVTENGEGDKYSSSEEKTYDQKLSELMIVVRTTLTELLLETTNEEISKVADETIKIFKSKASSAQVIRKSALSTLTDKLGLAAYGDSSSENDSDNDGSKSSKKTSSESESDNDSDEEIRNLIRVKRKAFMKTSEEIEDRVALAAAREEEKLKYFLRKEEEVKEYNHGKIERSLVRDPSNSGNSGHNMNIGYDKDFGEITETKIQNPNGKRQKERSSRRERITRFSDNKDKYVALPNAATFLTNLNSSTNLSSGNSTTAPKNNSQRQNIPDINGLLPNYKSTGMTNALNAADAALEKALKPKASTSNENQSRRHEAGRSYQSRKRRLSESKCSRSLSKSSSSTSSSSSSTSSNSDSSSTSPSSHHSKYKHRSSKKHKSHTHVERQHGKSHQDSRSKRKYQSSSYKKRDHESSSSRNRRNLSSDSEDDYRRRYRSDSNSTRNSSQIRSHTSSRRPHDREHSRSQSRSSYSSNNRRQ